jgi:hypothetical protein
MKLLKSIFVLSLSVFLLTGALASFSGTDAWAADQKVYKFRMQVLFGPSQLWQYKPFVDCRAGQRAGGSRSNSTPAPAGAHGPDAERLAPRGPSTWREGGGYWSNRIPLADIGARGCPSP